MMLNIYAQNSLTASKSEKQEKVRFYLKEAFGLKSLKITLK